MISKAKVKHIKSLQVKKYRKQEQSFIVEGAKAVKEVIDSDFEIIQVLATPSFLEEHNTLIQSVKAEISIVTQKELDGLGAFQSNDAAVAIVRMKPNHPLQIGKGKYALVLDDIRDPGNLGTIIRTADWYGVNKIIASEESADLYNPKVISATMGSFCRVQVYYGSLIEFLTNNSLPVYGSFLEGQSVHKTVFSPGGVLVIGNESRGISAGVEKFVTERITIPRFGSAESLNAGTAAAVILDNVRRSLSERLSVNR